MLLLYHIRYTTAIPRFFALHSTMLLLYQSDYNRLIIGIQLYIPLCFYYIASVYSTGAEMLNPLHSTMLLLYLSHIIKGSKDYLFTFHYASTISLKGALSGLKETPLHSTMLLLYLYRAAAVAYTCDLYIPLCFYYIISENLIALYMN